MQKNKSFPWVATPLALAISSFAVGNALASVTTDTSFGANGIASLNFNNPGVLYPRGPGYFHYYPETVPIFTRQTILELDNGNIVSFASRYEETGTATASTSYNFPCMCTVAEISYGSLIAGVSKTRMSHFTAGGVSVSTININGVMAISALEQPDGKLLLMGNDLVRGAGNWRSTRYLPGHGDYTSYNPAKPTMTSQIVLQRFNADGTADTSFDSDGVLRLGAPGARQGKGLVLMPDGKIVMLTADFNFTSSNPQLWRFNSDGSVDTTFGDSGYLTLPVANAWNLLRQQDNKLLIHYNDSNNQAYVRFNSDGSLDSSFAGDGTLNIAQPFYSLAPMLQQSDSTLLFSATNVYRYSLGGVYQQTLTLPAAGQNNPLSLAEATAGKVLVSRRYGYPSDRVYVFNSNATINTTIHLDGYSYNPNAFGDLLLQSNGGLLMSGVNSYSATLNRHIIPLGVKDDYNNDGTAGWIWKGVGNGNESASQNWQLTFPLYSNNWAVPNRFYHPAFPDQANWDMVTTGDFNNDGDADILWRNKITAQWKVWQMQNGLRNAQNDLADFDLAHAWQVIGAGDTDKDGDDDVILHNATTGEVIVWQMQNHAFVTAASVGTKVGYTLNRIGDFNKDGDVDLLFRQNGGDQLITWEMEANAFVAERTLASTGANYNPVCAGDFDKDGDDDILLINSVSHQEKWFAMESYARTQKFGGINTGFTFLGCGDYDGDGDADTVWKRDSDDVTRVVLQQNYGVIKQTVYSNAFGQNGFVYRGNSN